MTPGRRRRTFALVPRRPLVGTSYGTQRSLRRGLGTDVAGARPYRPGDRLASIDWNASARLSGFTGRDEFVVRQTFAEDAPRVIVIGDLRPAMALYPSGLPFFSKLDATREAVEAIIASALAAKAELGWLDVTGGRTTWLAPRAARTSELIERRLDAPHTAERDDLARAFHEIARRATEAPPGTFVFVVSDFLDAPHRDHWRPALQRRLDLVPVIVRDPVWESSFPDVPGVLLTVADPAGGRGAGLRLSAAQVRERRAANEARTAKVDEDLRALGLEPVLIESTVPAAVDAAFATWAARRRVLRRSAVRA